MALSRTTTRLIALAAVVLLAVGATWFVLRGNDVRTVTAHFTRAVGVYPGSDVRVLGVQVGTITDVVPEGGTVRVEMEYDADRPVPADAVAVIVPPSLVSDRYVQLAPVYRGGARLADGADIPVARTASPVELDDIYQSLNDLTVALGPDGANANGALRDLLEVGAANLEGNGAPINQSIGDLSDAVNTLEAGRADLFGSVQNLQQFVTALAQSDQQVRAFNANLASVAQQLAGERTALAAALTNLASALDQVNGFVRANRSLLESNLNGLAQVTGTLVAQREALAEFLDVAPTALSNLANVYNARSGTLDTRNNFNQLGDPAYVCALLMSLPLSQSIAPVISECQQAARFSPSFAATLGQVLRSLGVPLAAGVPAQSGTGQPPAPGPPPGSPGTGLPTIPGAPDRPAGGLPTIPGVTGPDSVTGSLTDAIGGLLGGGR